MDRHPDNHWVAERLAIVAPAWTPDLGRARTLVERRRPQRRIGVYGLAAATAAALVVVALLPAGRAVAQELWYRLLVTRVAVVRLDLSQVPLDTSIRTDGVQQPVADLREAAARAGFAPTLPPGDVLAEAPTLSVTSVIEVSQTIRTAALSAALARQGIGDVDVPAAWDGVTLRARIGPLVVAEYGQTAQIIQAAPIRLDLPTGFPLAQFAEVVFRTGGLSWWEARKFAEEFAARPALLLDLPRDEPAAIETIELPSGEALIVDDESDGHLRSTIIISRPTRLYTVSTPSRALSLQVASALP